MKKSQSIKKIGSYRMKIKRNVKNSKKIKEENSWQVKYLREAR